MNLARVIVVLAFALWAPFAARAEKVEQSMPDNAFLFEARLGGGSPLVVLGAGAFNTSITATPSLLLGARLIDRLHVGLGFSFTRLSGGGSDSNAVTFAPTVGADLIKSRDDRVAFYLKVGLPLGPIITCPQGPGKCDNGFGVGFDFALGVRYALHRMFALGLEAGAAGTFLNPQRNNTIGIVTFYGNLVASFMYGK